MSADDSGAVLEAPRGVAHHERVPSADPVAAANAVLASPAFGKQMRAALARRPVRNAADLARLADKVLRGQFAADLTGVQLVVTYDAATRNNVITAEREPAPRQVAHG